MAKISFSKALRDAMAEEMRRDPTVVLMGLDVGLYGGAFGASVGLLDEFGPERIMDMPISEAGYVGAAVGAAATGLRPIAELQFSDWITIACDQLVNQAAKMRYMFGGNITIPLVLRAPVGGYLAAAAQHSQMFESWFSFVPGLKVVLPATPADAKGLLKSAIRDNNPVIFFEHKKLYDMVGEVPDEEYVIPIGVADVKRTGKHLTIVSYGYTVHLALEAAEIVAQEGIEVEVIDLRTTSPLDKVTILKSVKKTNRLLVVQETWAPCSVSSEVVAVVAEEAMDYLDAPIRRITGKFVPSPFNPRLERSVLPSTELIADTVRQMVGHRV